MQRFVFLLIICVLSTGYVFAQKPRLYAGPMQGHTTDSTLTIWLMAAQKRAVNYSLSHNGEVVDQVSSKMVLEKENCWRKMCPVTLYFIGLQPGTGYQLSVQGADDTIHFQRKFYTLSEYDHHFPPSFTVLTGSCFMRGTGGLTQMVDNRSATPIYKAMKEVPADVMLWLGDNLYYIFEFISDRGMRRKNVETRLLPEIQGLITGKIHYSIWDDHEFGPNNSDGSFKRKDASTRIFHAFWPNPPEVRTTDQHYYSFRLFDAEFFMLDGRYHSDRGTISPHTLLGEDQLEWLKSSLIASEATFKILALGNQWHNDKRPGSRELFYGSTEYEPLMSFLDSMRIEGLFLLSGDVHYAVLQKVERPDSYPLYELTSSAVSSWPNTGPEKWPSSLSSYAVPETLFTGNNYSTLHFSGLAGSRSLTVSTYNIHGKKVWEYSIQEENLKYR